MDCLNIWFRPVRSDQNKTVLLSRVHPDGKSILSLKVKRLGESRRVPFSLSSPTYTSSRWWFLTTTRRLPSRLKLGLTTDGPPQFIIFAGFPEGFPVCGSVMISQRSASLDANDSSKSKTMRPSRTHSRSGPLLLSSLGSENTMLGGPPSRGTVSTLPPFPAAAGFTYARR